MIAAAVAVLVASLVGSVHCAAMCGGFVCFYAGAAEPNTRMTRPHLLYHGGRLVSYLMLGALAGGLGAGVTRVGALAGVSRAATLVAGTLMVAWGATTIAAQRGAHIAHPAAPAGWQRLLGGALASLKHQSASVRAGVTGLATTLLPCGWLYVFVALAGGTGKVVDGMLLMFVFWLGTVPALLAVGLGAQRALGPLRRHLPALSAFVVLAMGLLALSGRLSLSAESMAGMAPHGH